MVGLGFCTMFSDPPQKCDVQLRYVPPIFSSPNPVNVPVLILCNRQPCCKGVLKWDLKVQDKNSIRAARDLTNL